METVDYVKKGSRLTYRTILAQLYNYGVVYANYRHELIVFQCVGERLNEQSIANKKT